MTWYNNFWLRYFLENKNSTYDHRTLKTRLPVRSALFKQRTGGLVVRWVTTSEYPLLYVFAFFFACGPDSREVWFGWEGAVECGFWVGDISR
jgi:hypothetical protein